jgi:hypothetical protein
VAARVETGIPAWEFRSEEFTFVKRLARLFGNAFQRTMIEIRDGIQNVPQIYYRIMC